MFFVLLNTLLSLNTRYNPKPSIETTAVPIHAITVAAVTEEAAVASDMLPCTPILTYIDRKITAAEIASIAIVTQSLLLSGLLIRFFSLWVS